MKIGGVEFKKTDLIYQNGKIYYRAMVGLQNEGSKCVRNIGQYKLFAFHQDCAFPYIRYCLVDTKSNNVYQSGEYYYNLKDIQNNIIDELKSKLAGNGTI